MKSIKKTNHPDDKKKRDFAAAQKKHWVRLTRVCNNNCLFCLDKDAQNNSIIPFSEVMADLGKGIKNGCEKVILSGGEATLHPDFLLIVSEARKKGYGHVQVITNGRMFAYEDFIHRAVINGVSEITFSIHGHNARLHDCQTKVKGSFEQVIKALENSLKMPGLIVNIDIVINKINYRFLADIINFFADLGISEFDLLQIVPFGAAWENKEKLFYKISKALPYLQRAFSLAKKRNLFIWTNRFPTFFLEGFEDLIQPPNKLYDEIKGRKDIFRNFIRTGKEMICRSERCQYCFLSDFCNDLASLRSDKKICSKTGPLCLPKQRVLPRKHFYWKTMESINNFMDFFINHRYFIKSKNCKKCALNNQCDGAQCDFIRERGFKILKPLQPKKNG